MKGSKCKSGKGKSMKAGSQGMKKPGKGGGRAKTGPTKPSKKAGY